MDRPTTTRTKQLFWVEVIDLFLRVAFFQFRISYVFCDWNGIPLAVCVGCNQGFFRYIQVVEWDGYLRLCWFLAKDTVFQLGTPLSTRPPYRKSNWAHVIPVTSHVMLQETSGSYYNFPFFFQMYNLPLVLIKSSRAENRSIWNQ